MICLLFFPDLQDYVAFWKGVKIEKAAAQAV
jgi:hypothetical protein